jgi:acyl-CoA dehydrogenase
VASPRTIYKEEHELFRRSVKAFIDREIAPHYEDWEKQGHVTREVWRKAGEAGLLLTDMPEAYGGGGADFLYSAVMIEEMAKRVFTAPGFRLHSDIVAPYILNYGSEEQKRTWLPRMARGEIITAIAMTEPGTGSDLQSIRTTALRQGNELVVNGQKTFITNGGLADLVIVAAKTDTSAGAKGVTLVLVETDRPGFKRGRNLKKIGQNAQDTAELFFEDVRVPPSNILGEEGRGFACLMNQLPRERLVVAVGSVAIMEAALAWTIEYTRERKAFGKSLAGRGQDRGDGGACVPQPLHGAVPRRRPRRHHRCHEHVVADGARQQVARHLPAAVRRLRLHAGISDRARLRRCPRAPHLRRHDGDHEGAGGAVALAPAATRLDVMPASRRRRASGAKADTRKQPLKYRRRDMHLAWTPACAGVTSGWDSVGLQSKWERSVRCPSPFTAPAKAGPCRPSAAVRGRGSR